MCREAGRVEGDRIRQQAMEEAEELKQKVCSLQIPGWNQKPPHQFCTCALAIVRSYIANHTLLNICS